MALALAFALIVVPASSRAETEEEAVLGQLFGLNRTLETSQSQVARLDQQIAAVTAQQAAAQAERDRLDARRKDRLAHFGRRLRFYQETGTVTPIGYLLTSRNLIEFLERLELLQQVLEQDARLLAEIRELKTQVAAQEKKLADQRAELAALRQTQAEHVQSLQSDIAEKERLLASLQEKRAAVEQQLAALDEVWERTAKPVLYDLGSSLQTVDLNGFQPDSIKGTILPPGATIKISEATLNQLFTAKADLKGMTVKVLPERIVLEGTFSGTVMKVSGNFTVQGKTIIRFEPREIFVGAYKVPDKVTNEIMAQGKLDIDASAFMRGFSLLDVHLEAPYIVIKAGLK
jgi:hypothetical protein